MKKRFGFFFENRLQNWMQAFESRFLITFLYLKLSYFSWSFLFKKVLMLALFGSNFSKKKTLNELVKIS